MARALLFLGRLAEGELVEPRILIVGGGIGGLALGAALRSRAITYQIVERTPEIKAVGAGIAMGNNMLDVLRALGCADAIESGAYPIGVRIFMDSTGRLLRRVPLGSEGGLSGHRALLYDTLFHAAGPDRVKLGTTVKSFAATGEAVEVAFSDGSRDRYDVLVGADGVHSQIRTQLFPSFRAKYAGYISMRFIVPRPSAVPDAAVHMGGRGRALGFVPLNQEQVYCYAAMKAPDHVADTSDDRARRLRETFGEFGGAIPEILANLQPDTQVLSNRIEEVVLPSWVNGHVALLGDAAHSMRPDLAQGGAMAVEDAYVLAECLASTPTIETALASYERQRMPRVKTIQDAARRLSRLGMVESPWLVRLRDLAIRYAPMRIAPPEPLAGLARAA